MAETVPRAGAPLPPVPGRLVAGVVLLAAGLFLVLMAGVGAGIEALIFALRGLARSLACFLAAGGVALLSPRRPSRPA